MIAELRARFNTRYNPTQYAALCAGLDEQSGSKVGFRVAETPVFVPGAVLNEMANAGRPGLSSARGCALS